MSPFELITGTSNIEYKSDMSNLLNKSIGYNAMTKEMGNLFEMGIIDPVKVTKTGISNSFSVVNTLLSTNVVLINEN
jgi:chaperonin GroEL (HSP60 family)